MNWKIEFVIWIYYQTHKKFCLSFEVKLLSTWANVMLCLDYHIYTGYIVIVYTFKHDCRELLITINGKSTCTLDLIIAVAYKK